MKKCSSCKVQKEGNEFYRSNRYSDGLYYYCKDCWKSYCSSDSRKRKRNETNVKNEISISRRTYHREWNFKKKYGITISEFDKMREKQNYCCAICSKHESKCHNGLYVDHNHRTKEIRELLCKECNVAIGFFNEDTNIIFKAIEYLQNHSRNLVLIRKE